MTERIGSVVFILFGAVMLWAAQRIPPPVYESLGSGFFPTILSGLLILLGCLALIRSFRAVGIKETKRPLSATVRGWFNPTNGRILFCGLVTLAYVVVIRYTGFVVTTTAFLLVLMGFLSPKKINNIIYIIVVTAAYVLGIYFTFVHLLNIFLP